MKDISKKSPPELGDRLHAVHSRAEAFLKRSENVRSGASSSTTVSLSSDQLHQNNGGADIHNQRMENATDVLEVSQSAAEGGAHSRNSSSQHCIDNGNGEELTESFEPGVYITYIQMRSGVKIFKRVQFR